MGTSSEALQQLAVLGASGSRAEISTLEKRGLFSGLRHQIELSRQRHELSRHEIAAAVGRETGVKC